MACDANLVVCARFQLAHLVCNVGEEVEPLFFGRVVFDHAGKLDHLIGDSGHGR